MSIITNKDEFAHARIVDLVTREREIALSRREWKHRLAGYGFSIRETDAGDMVETLPHRTEVCVLPSIAA
ncbi:hypothetical protein [uncultured Tateyamaria sp.]|uniref:hypothetical protein n=1 Tax=uncultured Tateyamaria sp. TaxID=455651 RepID=UPI00260245FF|nr:hypothetical protein [uncultured Tateyamaria sp.]